MHEPPQLNLCLIWAAMDDERGAAGAGGARAGDGRVPRHEGGRDAIRARAGQGRRQATPGVGLPHLDQGESVS